MKWIGGASSGVLMQGEGGRNLTINGAYAAGLLVVCWLFVSRPAEGKKNCTFSSQQAEVGTSAQQRSFKAAPVRPQPQERLSFIFHCNPVACWRRGS